MSYPTYSQLDGSGTRGRAWQYGQVIEPRCVGVSAATSNKGIELTCLNGTAPAKRRAGPSPFRPAAHPRS
jgi:hypothetical protein